MLYRRVHARVSEISPCFTDNKFGTQYTAYDVLKQGSYGSLAIYLRHALGDSTLSVRQSVCYALHDTLPGIAASKQMQHWCVLYVPV